MILLIWPSSLLHFVMLMKGLLIFFVFSSNQFSVLLFLCVIYLVLISFISALIFIVFLLLLVLGLVYSCFSKTLRCMIRLFIWVVSFFLLYALIVINFPLIMAFAVSTDFSRLYFKFHWIPGCSWFLPLLLWSPTVFSAVWCSICMCLNISWSFFWCLGLVLFCWDLI
jgi:hypothetical protein